ncbi:MAG: HEPN domain-containing protein [Planctomycetes bacterium]|nr:HEPN domain-containing protein [Planctomycetota bacterium]
MPHSKNRPGSPGDWLLHARSDLALAKIPPPEDVMLEGLCFHAQQAAEKALKALLVSLNLEFPRTHNIGTLLDLLHEAVSVPSEVEEAASLTDYAVMTRYPGDTEPVDGDEYNQAIRLAEGVTDWVQQLLQ